MKKKNWVQAERSGMARGGHSDDPGINRPNVSPRSNACPFCLAMSSTAGLFDSDGLCIPGLAILIIPDVTDAHWGRAAPFRSFQECILSFAILIIPLPLSAQKGGSASEQLHLTRDATILVWLTTQPPDRARGRGPARGAHVAPRPPRAPAVAQLLAKLLEAIHDAHDEATRAGPGAPGWIRRSKECVAPHAGRPTALSKG